jgi:hypothetical protein
MVHETPAVAQVPADLSLDYQRSLWRGATEIIVDSTWSARSLQKAAARWSTIILALGLPANIITTVTAAGAGAAAVFVHNPLVTAPLALTAAVIAGMKSVLKPEETYHGYASKGADYLALRNDARHFRNVRLRSAGAGADDLANELKALTDRLNALTHRPPTRIPTWAYRQAKQSIEAGESDYQGDRFWEDPPF